MAGTTFKAKGIDGVCSSNGTGSIELGELCDSHLLLSSEMIVCMVDNFAYISLLWE